MFDVMSRHQPQKNRTKQATLYVIQESTCTEDEICTIECLKNYTRSWFHLN